MAAMLSYRGDMKATMSKNKLIYADPFLNKTSDNKNVPENPIAVLHIPHSSSFIPEEERANILLSDKCLATEVLKLTDWYTDELFTSDAGECEVVRYPVSRLVSAPERFEDDKLESMASRGMGVIYTKTSDGRILRHAVSSDMRKRILDLYYAPHHAKLSKVVSSILSKNGMTLVIDCHSFPSSPLPYENDQSENRADICIGTDSFHTTRLAHRYRELSFY